MNYRAIIQEAWALTQEEKRLIWWFAFAPALISSLVTMGYLSYQAAAFWGSNFFREEGPSNFFTELLDTTLSFLQSQPGVAVFLIVVAAVVGVIYIMLPVFTQGALIQLVADQRRGQPISIMKGVSYGFNRFLQLLEYHLFIKTFSFVSVFTTAVFVLRGLGLEAFAVFGWIFLLIFFVGLLLTLLFTYSEFYIVLDRRGVFKSILTSSGLVIRHFNHTMFMLILMAIISVRIVFNVLVALLVPLLVVGPVFFFASITLAKIGLVVGILIGVVALYFASYFLGVFHVFSIAVWTFTFLELLGKDQMEEQQKQEVE